jgi:hypothetical protein
MISPQKRLTPASETIKKLLLRSGNECAFPGCLEVLFNDDNKLIAECCHIEAALPGGERYNYNQSDEQRRSYDNLLFLCHKHHIETNNVNDYTVEILRKIKSDHENRFKEKLFAIRPNYVEQVYSSFSKVINLVEDTASRVKDIDEKQDRLLDLIKQNNARIDAPIFQEYFGVPPTSGFEGRVEELEELASAFDSYSTIIIEGISGIGKTSLIANFLGNKNDYKTLWIDCETIKNRHELFEYAAKFIFQEFNDDSITALLSSLDDDKINRALLQSFRQHQSCIVFDAVNIELHELIPTVKYWNQYLTESKLFISTNQNINSIWHNPVYKLQLKGLDEDSFFSILYNFDVGKNVTSIKLYNLIGGHPYLLKLCIAVIEYLPIDELIIEIERHNTSEINDYIKVKAFETLTNNDLILLNTLALLAIPFRFSIGKFIQTEDFRKSFKDFRKKFLVENYHNDFFIIPEFIRVQIVKVDNDLKNLSSNFVEYLRSIHNDARVFEKEALIYHAVRADMIEVAKIESQKFLSALMTHGHFNLAFKVATGLEDESSFKDWSYIYYIKGRVFRFQESYEKALKCYNTGLNLSLDSVELNTFQFEKASLLIYLSRYKDNASLKDEAISIYEHLGKAENATLALQCHLSIAYTLLSDGKFVEVINKLRACLGIEKDGDRTIIAVTKH